MIFSLKVEEIYAFFEVITDFSTSLKIQAFFNIPKTDHSYIAYNKFYSNNNLSQINIEKALIRIFSDPNNYEKNSNALCIVWLSVKWHLTKDFLC